MRVVKIRELARIAEEEGVAAIYPSDDDNLEWKAYV